MVKILTGDNGLPLLYTMQIGGEDIAELPQSLTIVSGGQLLLLDRQFPCEPGAEILNIFAHLPQKFILTGRISVGGGKTVLLT